jgi:uncharacterized protein with HEPN domain
MPPTLADRLEHILTAIETVEQALAEKQVEDITGDLMLRLAVERAFEIICEASRRIPEDVKNQQPDIDWRGMVDFGNRRGMRIIASSRTHCGTSPDAICRR